jgi:hypothetical protein
MAPATKNRCACGGLHSSPTGHLPKEKPNNEIMSNTTTKENQGLSILREMRISLECSLQQLQAWNAREENEEVKRSIQKRIEDISTALHDITSSKRNAIMLLLGNENPMHDGVLIAALENIVNYDAAVQLEMGSPQEIAQTALKQYRGEQA